MFTKLSNQTKLFVLFVILLMVVTVLVLTTRVEAGASPTVWPRAMRLQNSEPIDVPADTWILCTWDWIAEGDGVHRPTLGAFTIDQEYNGAMLTVNINMRDFGSYYRPRITVRMIGAGGPWDETITLYDGFDNVISVAWPIQAIHDAYIIEVMSTEDRVMDMCRVSVQVNR